VEPERRRVPQMRKCMTFVACAAFLAVVATTLLAQTNLPGREAQGASDKANMVIKKRMLGIITSVDVSAKRVVIRYRDAEVPFEVNAATKIKLDGKKCTLESIQSGQKVTIVYRREYKKRIAMFMVVESDSANQGLRSTKSGRD
jgi:hypothetical protein